MARRVAKLPGSVARGTRRSSSSLMVRVIEDHLRFGRTSRSILAIGHGEPTCSARVGAFIGVAPWAAPITPRLILRSLFFVKLDVDAQFTCPHQSSAWLASAICWIEVLLIFRSVSFTVAAGDCDFRSPPLPASRLPLSPPSPPAFRRPFARRQAESSVASSSSWVSLARLAYSSQRRSSIYNIFNLVDSASFRQRESRCLIAGKRLGCVHPDMWATYLVPSSHHSTYLI